MPVIENIATCPSNIQVKKLAPLEEWENQENQHEHQFENQSHQLVLKELAKNAAR